MKSAVHFPGESTRYTLIGRLENRSDQESWRDFFDTYWRMIYALALRSGLTEVESQDVVQETVISVVRDIHKFKRDRSLGSFRSWLQNIIRWRIVDQFRLRSPGKKVKGGEDPVEVPLSHLAEMPDAASSDLEVMWDEEWRNNLFQRAVDRVKQRLKEEHFQIFDLHVNQGWPAGKVARAMEVSVGQVYLIKHRVSLLIRKEIARLEQSPLESPLE